jgi:hypothetical protein
MGCGSATHRLASLEAPETESVRGQGLQDPQMVDCVLGEQVDQRCKELGGLDENNESRTTFESIDDLGTEDEEVRQDVVLDQNTKIVIDKAKLQEIFEHMELELGSDWEKRMEETLVQMRADKARAETDLRAVQTQLKRTEENLGRKSKNTMFELSLARADRLHVEEVVKQVKAENAKREALLMYENRSLTTKLKLIEPIMFRQELHNDGWV